MQELRLLQEKDLESIYSIYVHYVKTSVAIFDVVPDSFDVFKEHMMEMLVLGITVLILSLSIVLIRYASAKFPSDNKEEHNG